MKKKIVLFLIILYALLNPKFVHAGEIMENDTFQNDDIEIYNEYATDPEEDQGGYQDRDTISEDQTETQQMINPNFEVMVIFSIGLIAGIMVGNILTGFIK